MELTPTVLIGIGEVPAQALTRFKQESLWRPAPVRSLARVLFVGQAPPEPAGVLAGVAHAWTAGDCTWLPAEEGLPEALRQAQADSLSAANLEAVRALPGYTVRIREYQETFAPEACILADATAPGPLSRVLATAFKIFGRPATLVLTLPAPYEESWAPARDLVRRLASGPEAALLERIWLVSREQEIGEVLEPVDLADALSLFCELFACSGWLSEPSRRPFFIRELTDVGGLLATFGLRACRYSAPHAVQQHLLDDARRITGELLDDRDAASFDLDEALARGRDGARSRAPAIEMPAPGEDRAEQWQARAKLRWAPAAQQAARAAVAEALAPLAGHVAQPLTAPARQAAELNGLVAEIRRHQGDLPRPTPPGDVAPVFERLADLRRVDRWWPLVTKAVISVIVAGALVWSFLPPGSTGPAAAVTAVAWAILLGVLVVRNIGERQQAVRELHGALHGWAEARLEGLLYAETLQQLQALAEVAQAAATEAEGAVERLRGASVFLDEEARHPALPPARTALVSPCPGAWPVELEAVSASELTALSPAEMAARLLERPWRGAPVLLGDEAEPSAVQQEFVDGHPVHLLLPVRSIQPSDGEPLRHGSLVMSAGSPFLWARFVLTRPFALAGSARLDPGSEERRVGV